jgi:hypothetical protein
MVWTWPGHVVVLTPPALDHLVPSPALDDLGPDGLDDPLYVRREVRVVAKLLPLSLLESVDLGELFVSEELSLHIVDVHTLEGDGDDRLVCVGVQCGLDLGEDVVLLVRLPLLLEGLQPLLVNQHDDGGAPLQSLFEAWSASWPAEIVARSRKMAPSPNSLETTSTIRPAIYSAVRRRR